MAVQTPNRIGNEQLDLLAYRRLALLIDGAVFVLFRWHRSCQAYRAMIVLAACDFVAGSIVGAWVLHFVSPSVPTVRDEYLPNRDPRVTRSLSGCPAAQPANASPFDVRCRE